MKQPCLWQNETFSDLVLGKSQNFQTLFYEIVETLKPSYMKEIHEKHPIWESHPRVSRLLTESMYIQIMVYNGAW